ncbi:MAG TPA: sigma-54 dependent transcriptional regulator [Chitinophagaceae bacterium]|nr:sigma-54 dependent transcriptional regulator [Chitinophagaceae bacterium]
MDKGKVLIVDDEQTLRSLLKRIISLEGFAVQEAGSLAEAERLLREDPADVVLCDVKLPDGSGVDFVVRARTAFPQVEILLLTAYGNLSDGIQAMKNGAFDYLLKGNDNDKVIPLLYRALEKGALQRRLRQLEERVGKQYRFESILGHSARLRESVALAARVAQTDTTVLLLGETGTGKEVFAQAIHQAGRRAMQPFVALNCSAFSSELLESELFGHRAGAFTGAVKDKKGLIEEAAKGTLFLDEIGEMPPDLQAKLLRVLEAREFIKVGDVRPTRADVRILAATNRDLRQQVEQGRFREDLYYRLAVFTIHLPALRERPEDIPELAEHFLRRFAAQVNARVTGMTPAFLDILRRQPWKGNIRELKNVMERAVILAEGSELKPDQLPFELREMPQAGESPLSLAEMEKQHIRRVLEITHHNKTRAADILGIGLTTLYRKLEEYQIVAG